MNVALSDLLTCPRCGPGYGLVLLPNEVKDRRVASGLLGCANCRERYPVEGGVADLRAGPALEEMAAGGPSSREAAVRLAALMGLAESRGTVVVAGPASVHAAELSGLVDGVEVVAVDGMPGPGVSPIRVSETLPLRNGAAAAVALTGSRTALVAEAARVVGPAGRVVLEPAPAGARERVEEAGLTVVLEEDGVLVARRGV